MEQTGASNPKMLRRISWLFFLALALFYLSLTPGTIEGQGYNQENLIASNQIVTNIVNFAKGQPLAPIQWTRHGFIEPLFQLPFAAAGRLIFGDSVKWAGRLMIFQPILATSLLCTLLLIWIYRLTANLRMALLLAGCAGLGTMLWPYAYVGLETTQSLALLVAAYLALGRKPQRSWPEVLLFGAACAVTLAVKLNGVFLAPAIGFLVLEYFGVTKNALELRLPIHRRDAANAESAQDDRKAHLGKLVCALTIIAISYTLNHWAKARYWAGADAGTNYYWDILVDSPLTAALQAFAYFGSPNKSLLLFCPILALCFVALGKAWRQQPRIVIFAMLALGGLIAGFSITRMWADETWGPRYLHATIAPLILCLAAAKSATGFSWKKELPVLALFSLGLSISLLGSFFSYSHLHNAAIKSSQATLETLQFDPTWNHVRFNWQLMKVWVDGNSDSSHPKLWPPPHHWWFSRPEDAPAEKTVDLREFAYPQPMLAQSWRPTISAPPQGFSILRWSCAVFLAVGLIGLALAWRQASKFDQSLGNFGAPK